VSPDQVLTVVRETIVTVLEVDPGVVSRETDLVADLRADSLALVEIVELVEERLMRLAGQPRFRIDDDDIEKLRTVGDAVDYALSRL
jgi:acyl carrier protein